MLYYDYYYLILVVPALILSLVIQFHLRSTYSKFSSVANSKGYTGSAIAREILANAQSSVSVESVQGTLSDHFDPTAGRVRLSSAVYNGTSVAAIGIAAHECGHALQYQAHYTPMFVRNAVVKVTNFSSALIYPLIILSVLLRLGGLLKIAVLCFFIIFLFQLITLPVEFNASKRALDIIKNSGFSEQDVSGVKSVLGAAAMTYVAAMIVAFMNFLSFLMRVRGRNK